MDHHCPWIGQCVGQNNQKFYILFLFYTVLTLIFCIAHYLYDIVLYGEDFDKHFTEWEKFQVKVAFMIKLAAILSIGFLLYFQVKINLRNLTTIEHHIDDIIKRNPFDKGEWKANFKTIFGDDFKTWLFPVKPRFKRKERYDSLEDDL